MISRLEDIRDDLEKEKIGYEFEDKKILLQAVIHKSMSEKIWNQYQMYFKNSDITPRDQEAVMSFNHQILEYMGDSILNFAVSKLFYCETAECL